MTALWIRERLWRASNWCAELVQLRQIVRSREQLAELAEATELCDPDRGRALALYLEAWRAGHVAARDRAKALASELHAHVTLAELAAAEGDLIGAGEAYLDAGLPELAVDPLTKFSTQRPPGASPMTETVRLEAVKPLLAIAQHHRIDIEAEVTSTLARARHPRGAPPATYRHAARVARAGNRDDLAGTVLAAAAQACPADEAIAALVEARLIEKRDPEGLIAHYRARFERAEGRADYVARVRAAGISLIANDLQPGLGLRLLRMALENAYSAMLPEVRAHIAMWELIATHARVQHSTLELVPLIVQALAAPLSSDVALYLARLGLEIVWRDAGDTLAAQPYAAMVLDYVPDHPLAQEFVRLVAPEEAVAPAAPSAPKPSSERPTAAMPPLPKPTFPYVAPPVHPTSRMPLVEGQIKRVGVSSPPPATTGATGRLALLRPPPPRATSLKRDTSPFPIAPARPAKTTIPRAPRKVVPVDAVVELPDGGFFSTVLRDVSTTGAFIVTKRPLAIDAIVALDMKIPQPGAVGHASHRTNARIARRTDIGYGLAFIAASAELVEAIRAATESS